jgi:guanylate kinase
MKVVEEEPSAAFLEQVANYTLPPERAGQLADKVLVPVIGIACVGKTTVIDLVAEQNNDFHRVQTLTTRPASPRDVSGTMRHLPHNQQGFDKLAKLMDAGELAQIESHPTTGYFYATELSDYPKPYNIIPILAKAMPNIRKLPFQRIDSIAITAQPEFWQNWFRSRYAGKDNQAEARKRLDEGESSLRWCLGDDFVQWVTNEPGRASQTASDLIYAVETGSALRSGGRHAAKRMLDSLASFRGEFDDQEQAAS